MEEDYVSQRPNGVRDYCGVSNLIIPKDKVRQDYITTCFRTGRISILLENGGELHGVFCSKSAMRDLEFPDDYQTLGSQVIWVNKPRTNQPIVIGIFDKNNEFVDLSDTKGALRRKSGTGVQEVIVDTKKGVVIINSAASGDVGGDIYILASNKAQAADKKARMRVNVGGGIDMQTPEFNITNTKTFTFTVKDTDVDDQSTTMSYEKGKGFSYQDEFGNKQYMNKDNIQFSPKKAFNIGSGKEPMLLGNTTKTLLNDLLTAIGNITVSTAFGPSGTPINAPAFQALAQQLSQLLSKISNTD